MRPVGTVAVATAILIMASSASSAASFTTAEDANHVGENATVCGQVASAHYAPSMKAKPTFLNLDKPYPNQVFTQSSLAPTGRSSARPRCRCRARASASPAKSSFIGASPRSSSTTTTRSPSGEFPEIGVALFLPDAAAAECATNHIRPPVGGAARRSSRLCPMPLMITDPGVVALSGAAVHTIARRTGDLTDLIPGVVSDITPGRTQRPLSFGLHYGAAAHDIGRQDCQAPFDPFLPMPAPRGPDGIPNLASRAPPIAIVP